MPRTGRRHSAHVQLRPLSLPECLSLSPLPCVLQGCQCVHAITCTREGAVVHACVHVCGSARVCVCVPADVSVFSVLESQWFSAV